MNILAIDTTTKKANVGIYINGKKYLKTIDNEITHSEKLLPLIDEVLKQANCSLTSIDVYACTTGPGSFTGIRIGLATVKALAKLANNKIFAINSLELLANQVFTLSNHKIIVPLLDAKNKRAYYGIYNKDKQNELNNTLGNKYIKDIIQEIKNYCDTNNMNLKTDILFVLDNENMVNTLCEENNFNYIVHTINLETLIDLASNTTNFSNYLELDATYVRSSEAERTKYGE